MKSPRIGLLTDEYRQQFLYVDIDQDSFDACAGGTGRGTVVAEVNSKDPLRTLTQYRLLSTGDWRLNVANVVRVGGKVLIGVDGFRAL